MSRFLAGMFIMAGACVFASWAMVIHAYYLVPINCFTFALGTYQMVKSHG